ncbi:nucleotide-diphospho-sugar transferase domain-containing protein [Ditylenchus destructor]|nr:nucleotide-diphospho-sugar transferase domain-containing protein [Ditylenchus destructor]
MKSENIPNEKGDKLSEMSKLKAVRNTKFFRLSTWNVVGVILLALVGRKFWMGHTAMKYVHQCSSEVTLEKMMASTYLRRTIQALPSNKPSLVLILNQYALNMTLNWLCNTEHMPGVHSSLLIVTMDAVSDRRLEEIWPNVNRLNWNMPCLSDGFNYGDGRYQLFYVFRGNLARALIEHGKSFWMIQQDTYWYKNLLDLDVNSESKNVNADIVFDRAAESDASKLIAGGYFLVRPTEGSKRFFTALVNYIQYWYVPDNAYMTSLCADSALDVKCGFVPFSALTNWIWFFQPNRRAGSDKVPMLVQFDGDTKLGGKLAKIRGLGFNFSDDNGKCYTDAIGDARKIVEQLVEQKHDSMSDASNGTEWKISRSYSQWQFGMYQAIIDQLYKFRITELFLNKIVYPFAYYFMITL